MRFQLLENRICANLKCVFAILFFVLLAYPIYGISNISVSEIEGIPGKTDEDKIRKEVCAHFNASHGTSFDIYDGSNHSQGLEAIHDSSLYESIYSVIVRLGCVVRICVLDFLNQDTPLRKRVCSNLNTSQDLDYEEYFYIVTTRCSCKIPAADCEKESCGGVELGEEECARLFVESKCTKCNFDSISLNENESLTPTNGFSTESFVIREGCRLNIYSNSKDNDTRPAFSYKGIQEKIQLSYVQRPVPSRFTCNCGADYEESLSDLPDLGKSDSLQIAIGTSVAILLVLIILAVIAFVFVRRRLKEFLSAQKVQEKSRQDIIREFQNGIQEEQFRAHIPQGNIHYVSAGFDAALVLPYQSRGEVCRSDLTIGEEIERGNFGKVSFGKLRRKDGSIIDVAVKECKPSADCIYFTSLLDEIKIQSFLGTHPNIVNFLGACTTDLNHRDAILLLELCEEGSLKNYLQQNRESLLKQNFAKVTLPICRDNGYASFESLSASSNSESDVILKPRRLSKEAFQFLVKLCTQIASGMEYLGTKNVIHIDLAARNVLLTSDLVAKISDFGLSQRIREVGTYARIKEEYPLPIRWMSLESLEEQRFTVYSDVWSYGVTLWELFTLGEDPYENLQINYYSDLVAYLRNDGRLLKPIFATDDIYAVMSTCWLQIPERRPSFGELRFLFESVLAKFRK